MKEYLEKYDSIEKRWRDCIAAIDAEICKKLVVPQVQIVIKMSTEAHPSALENINSRFFTITILKIINGECVYDRYWYQNNEELKLVSQIIDRISREFGFEFITIEKEEQPVFVVNLI